MVEELTEVLTAARFHPVHCHTLAYGTSKGSVCVADTRTRALCDGPGGARRLQTFGAPPMPCQQGSDALFGEMLGAVSDLRYSLDGRFLIARDYMSVKVRRMGGPVAQCPCGGGGVGARPGPPT